MSDAKEFETMVAFDRERWSEWDCDVLGCSTCKDPQMLAAFAQSCGVVVEDVGKVLRLLLRFSRQPKSWDQLQGNYVGMIERRLRLEHHDSEHDSDSGESNSDEDFMEDFDFPKVEGVGLATERFPWITDVFDDRHESSYCAWNLDESPRLLTIKICEELPHTSRASLARTVAHLQGWAKKCTHAMRAPCYDINGEEEELDSDDSEAGIEYPW